MPLWNDPPGQVRAFLTWPVWNPSLASRSGAVVAHVVEANRVSGHWEGGEGESGNLEERLIRPGVWIVREHCNKPDRGHREWLIEVGE
jgi:hypothetical protein